MERLLAVDLLQKLTEIVLAGFPHNRETLSKELLVGKVEALKPYFLEYFSEKVKSLLRNPLVYVGLCDSAPPENVQTLKYLLHCLPIPLQI